MAKASTGKRQAKATKRTTEQNRAPHLGTPKTPAGIPTKYAREAVARFIALAEQFREAARAADLTRAVATLQQAGEVLLLAMRGGVLPANGWPEWHEQQGTTGDTLQPGRGLVLDLSAALRLHPHARLFLHYAEAELPGEADFTRGQLTYLDSRQLDESQARVLCIDQCSRLARCCEALADRIDPETRSIRAQRLADGWRDLAKSATVGAERAEWHGDGASKPTPAPFQGGADPGRYLAAVDGQCIEPEPRRWAQALFTHGTEAERKRILARLRALADESCAVSGVAVKPGTRAVQALTAWAAHLFTLAPVEWWGFGGRYGSTLVRGRDDAPARFGTIIDVGAASAEALDRFAGELGDGTDDPFRPISWLVNSLGLNYEAVRSVIRKADPPIRKREREVNGRDKHEYALRDLANAMPAHEVLILAEIHRINSVGLTGR